jgi:ankyrin repeat protein
MPSGKHPLVLRLRAQPDLIQLKRQAKELLTAFAAGEVDAVAVVNAHCQGVRPNSFALHDAQLVLARSYGFASWPKLKAYVDGVTVRRLADAVRAGDLPAVRAMLDARPELVNLCVAEDDEQRALHYAVIARHAEMVRLLMQRGADSRAGIWPHRDATPPRVLARERGYTEILAIMEEEDTRRNPELATAVGSPEIMRAFERGDEGTIIAALDAHRALIHASDERGRTALHWAAARLWPQLAAWLVDHGTDVNARTRHGDISMDLLGDDTDAKAVDQPHLIEALAGMLRKSGSERTARWAIVASDAHWLRARHAEGALSHQRGLLTHAVRSDRLEALRLLLDLGLDPDEAGKVEGLDEVVLTFGEPLRTCALSGQLAMAECLLQHGANANTSVYAASSALFCAHEQRNAAMIALLEQHGARLDPTSVGALGLADRAAVLLKDAADGQQKEGSLGAASSVAEGLMWGAIERPAPAIVQMAVSHVDWPRDDERWYRILQNGLYPSAEGNPAGHLEGLRLVLDRADPNIRNTRGATLLHYLAASHGHRTANDRHVFASLLLDAGARLDLRDDLLNSSPLGWACRWGRIELVRLFLERGADPNEPGAEPWATPMAWAERMRRTDVLAILRIHPRLKH